MQLTSENVRSVFMSLLFKTGEDTSMHVIGEGALLKAGFHPDRLKEREKDIEDMLLQLPEQFMKSGGGGWSFLNACEDKNGVQWAGLHASIDELLAMGIACKKASYLMPRDAWDIFPGGMPYFVVND